MIEVEDLSETDIKDLLTSVGYGHLACCRGERPYVVPVHYAYENDQIFVYTTEGKKVDIIEENPNVCLQVEHVVDNHNWRSVIVDGIASQLDAGPERDRALKLIIAVNPTLTPAVSIRWMDDWVRENIEVVYVITPNATSGRRTVDRTGNKPFVPAPDGEGEKIF